MGKPLCEHNLTHLCMQYQLVDGISALSSACSEGGSSLSFAVAQLSTANMVSHIQDKITLEIEDSYFQPLQYHNFNYHSTHNYILFGIDLAHYKQCLEYKGPKVPSILGLLLEDIEVRGGDGVEVYVRSALSFNQYM